MSIRCPHNKIDGLSWTLWKTELSMLECTFINLLTWWWIVNIEKGNIYLSNVAFGKQNDVIERAVYM